MGVLRALAAALQHRAPAVELAPEALSQIRRARAGGYPITAYRGLREAYEPRDGIQFFGGTPRTAQTYAQMRGPQEGNIMPAQLRMARPLVIDAGGLPWNQISRSQLRGLGLDVPQDFRLARGASTGEIAMAARDSGKYDGVIFRNVAERWKQPGPSPEWLDDIYAVWDPRQIRLRHARFRDPTSIDPLAGLAVAAPSAGLIGLRTTEDDG